MIVFYKTFRFRAYPSREQVERLDRWQHAMRFVWNLAHEQRLLGLSRCGSDRVYVGLAQQQREFGPLRSEHPWLEDVPRHVIGAVLTDLDRAWQRYLLKVSKKPLFKKKSDRPSALRESASGAWRFTADGARFPKLGQLRVVKHREVTGRRMGCSLRCDRAGDWFFCVDTEHESPSGEERGQRGPVAIDRGVNAIIADSNGRLVSNPMINKKLERAIRRASKTMSRRMVGSSRHARARVHVAKLYRLAARRRADFLHRESVGYAKNHGIVVLEDLNVAGMMKSNLGGRIWDASWTLFSTMLRYKLARVGGGIVEVHAAYSSQTCSACACVDAASRRGERFGCTHCGHIDHADLNAAKVLLTRASRSGLTVEGSAPKASRRSGKRLRVLKRVPKVTKSPDYEMGE